MRKLFLILLMMPLIALGQDSDTIPQKKANKIIVRNANSKRQNFFLLQTLLAGKGYTVIVNYRDFTLHTRDSLTESGVATYRIDGSVQGDSVILTGKYTSGAALSVLENRNHLFNYDISNTGLKGSLPQKMFALLTNLAKEMGTSIQYIKETKRRRGVIF